MKEISAKVTKKKEIASSVCELELKLPLDPKFSFKPGQFMEFCIGKDSRMYSIVSSKTELPQLRFLIKQLEAGVGSGYVQSLNIGDDVLMRGPFGNFLEEIPDEPSIFFATGVGVAPFLSAIPARLNKAFRSELTLYLGVRSQYEILYGEFFKKLEKRFSNFRFIPVISKPEPGWNGIFGRITEYLPGHLEILTAKRYYICGGLESVSDIRAELLAGGVRASQIEQEMFT